MKLLFKFFLLLSLVMTQDYIDIVYLNNGDIIKGQIIENEIDNYVKIELSGGSVLTYSYSDIKIIGVEQSSYKDRDLAVKANYSKNRLKNAGQNLQNFRSKYYLGTILSAIGFFIVISDTDENGDSTPLGPIMMFAGSLIQLFSFSDIGQAGEEIEKAAENLP
tara:strand:- start:308 stop:796 length:489 start_codon:yes stop_codon:yes gene_type:complete